MTEAPLVNLRLPTADGGVIHMQADDVALAHWVADPHAFGRAVGDAFYVFKKGEA